MKSSVIGKKFFYTCVVLGGVLTSCGSGTPSAGDGEPGITPPPGLYRMSFHASEYHSTEARASVEEGSMDDEQSRTFRWDAGDRIMVWSGQSADELTPCLFESENGGLKTALFEYEGDEVKSNLYFGFYPYADGLQYNRIDITVPTDGSIIQTAKNDARHLGAYRPMYTPVVSRTTDASELTGMTFCHLTGLLYFRIQNETGREATVEEVGLRSSVGIFSNHGTLKFTPEASDKDTQFDLADAKRSEKVSLSLGIEKKGIILAHGEGMQAFLPVLPVETLADSGLTLVLKANGREYVSLAIDEADIASLKQGYDYRFDLRLKPEGIEVDVVIADWEPGEDIGIPVS